MNREAWLRKKEFTVEDLREIVRILRGEDGCPWDRVQTHQSIRNNLIEETYEAVEGIDRGDPAVLREELGDVLLQVIYHTCMEEEAGNFTFDDAVHDVCAKLIYRHPHIFGTVEASTEEEVLKNWDALKAAEKGHSTPAEELAAVSSALPALLRAGKLAKKADKHGLPVPGSKAETEIAEAGAAAVGDAFFALAAAAVRHGIEPEQALYDACCRYTDSLCRAEHGEVENS